MSSFFVDTIGSFIRPQSIVEGIEKRNKKEITNEDLQKIEDAEIKLLVEKQVKAGLTVVGDGEFRRWGYWYDFWAGFLGVKTNSEYPKFPNQIVNSYIGDTKFEAFTPYVTEKILYNPFHPEFRAWEFLRSVTPKGIIPKVIVPSPNFLLVFRDWKTDKFPASYKTLDNFLADIAEVLKQTLLHFYSLGARLIQIDEPTWFIWAYSLGNTAEDQLQALKDLIEYDIKALKPALDALPADCEVGIHICRGNGHFNWQVNHGYKETLNGFAQLNPHYLLLEWHDSRSGSFEILKDYAVQCPRTKFFLGVISTKNADVDKIEDVEAKILEASKYVPLERLGACPQCGFHTLLNLKNATTEEAQWGKIAVLGELQKKLWKK